MFARNCGVILIPHHPAYKQGWRGQNWSVLDPTVSPVVEIFSVDCVFVTFSNSGLIIEAFLMKIQLSWEMQFHAENPLFRLNLHLDVLNSGLLKFLTKGLESHFFIKSHSPNLGRQVEIRDPLRPAIVHDDLKDLPPDTPTAVFAQDGHSANLAILVHPRRSDGRAVSIRGQYVPAIGIFGIQLDALGDILFLDEHGSPNAGQFGSFIRPSYNRCDDIVHSKEEVYQDIRVTGCKLSRMQDIRIQQ